MNIHVPQSSQAEADAITLMGVEASVLSEGSGGVSMTPIQDATLGLYKLSQPVFLDKSEFSMLWAQLKYPKPPNFPDPAIVSRDGRDVWTGQQLLSCMFPSDFNYERNGVVVRQGILIQGELTKSTALGGGPTSLCSTLARLSTRAYIEFLSDSQRACILFLREIYGFTCGIRDFIPPDEAVKDAASIAKSASDAVKRASSETEVPEHLMCFAMNKVLPLANAAFKKHLRNSSNSTNLLQMITSGSKGKIMNPVQVRVFEWMTPRCAHKHHSRKQTNKQSRRLGCLLASNQFLASALRRPKIIRARSHTLRKDLSRPSHEVSSFPGS